MNVPGSVIKAMDKKAHLHLYHLHNDVTTDNIIEYLQSLKFENCIVTKLQSKYPQSYASYRITAPFNLLNEISNQDIWPEGAKIQRYFFHRAKGKNSPS